MDDEWLVLEHLYIDESTDRQVCRDRQIAEEVFMAEESD